MACVPFVWQYIAQKIFEMSRVSTFDYICIVAEFNCILTGEKDNTEDLRRRGFSEAQINAAQKQSKLNRKELNGLVFTVPLHKFKYENLGYVLTLFENYERGQLPFPGSVSEQPAQIMDILNIIQNLKLEQQKKVDKESRR